MCPTFDKEVGAQVSVPRTDPSQMDEETGIHINEERQTNQLADGNQPPTRRMSEEQNGLW